MKHLPLLFWLVCVACEMGATGWAFGHGFAGARFFPATLSTDDPFVADELSLPTVSTIRTPDDGGTRQADISVDISKRITPQFAIEIGIARRDKDVIASEARTQLCIIVASRGGHEVLNLLV